MHESTRWTQSVHLPVDEGGDDMGTMPLFPVEYRCITMGINLRKRLSCGDLAGEMLSSACGGKKVDAIHLALTAPTPEQP